MFRNLTTWILSLMFLTGTIHCTHPRKSIAAENRQMAIQLERTGCLGPCPVYTLTLYRDHSLEFNGRSHTLVSGLQRDTLSADAFEQLVEDFRKSGFGQLDSIYDQPVTDAPFTHLTFQDGRMKKVSVRGDAPDVFTELVSQMESLAEEAGWLARKFTRTMQERELIVELRPEVTTEELAEAFVEYNLTFIRKITPAQRYFLFRIESDDPDEALLAIRESPLVNAAQWNHRLKRRDR
jgi:hypothetical protein